MKTDIFSDQVVYDLLVPDHQIGYMEMQEPLDLDLHTCPPW